MPTATLLGTTRSEPTSTVPAAAGARSYSLGVISPWVNHRSSRRVDPLSESSISTANGWGDTDTSGVPSPT